MSAVDSRTFEIVKDVVLSAQQNCTTAEKIDFYNVWASTFEQDSTVVDYRAPSLAASAVSTHFSGKRQAAVVLDVACGTGMVAKLMKKNGFEHFVGVDGSEAMLQRATETGLYQDLKLAVLGQNPLPVQSDHFDVVVIVGALSMAHIHVKVIRELCQAAKQGGLICMTTRGNIDNLSYKAALEDEIKQMEEEGLWCCVEVTEVKEWERAVTAYEEGYIPGCVYLFKKL
ncbi:methyltransferase-like protein 27 [Dunckerocampus dactyliophorus]|uniref:methyltransferase-like protein 27 n=1 Tax=Dunckerocampus dactyliophorus TaxID=161453 RepID=UPI002405DA4E|nr:methyltransferase-like protein 27 [Dunckerocampus dactyliophorus]XP_054610450.1 methyltransferase-like protein 27 [Dunckerocampus dactyliophorus]